MSTRHLLMQCTAIAAGIALSLTAFAADINDPSNAAQKPATDSQTVSVRPIESLADGLMSGTHPTLDSTLGSMVERTGSDGRKRAGAGVSASSLMLVNGMAPIVAVAKPGQVEQLRAQAETLGMKNIIVTGNSVFGDLPPSAAGPLGALETLSFARMSGGFKTNAGSVTTQGDRSMKSDTVRQRSGLTGAGVKVGVISDSYDTLKGAAAGVRSGNLPGTGNPTGATSPIQILEDAPEGIDEGRAMLEIVHDVAPGASLAFHQVGNNEASFAKAVRALAASGAQVIVDDIGFFFAPHFQDGIGARAVDEVVAKGVTYFTSAGNQAREAYESSAVPGAPVALAAPDGSPIGNYYPHLFFTNDRGASPFLKVTVRKSEDGDETIPLVLQWSQPWASVQEGATGSQTDWDIFAFQAPDFSTLFSGTAVPEIGRDALTGPRVTLTGPAGATVVFYVAIMAPISRTINPLAPGQNNAFALLDKVRFYIPGSRFSTDSTPAGTVVGHQNSAGAISLCAAQYNAIDANGGYIARDFTSVGDVVIRRNKNGERTFDNRQKPDLCGPDGGNTSFFAPFGANDFDNDGFPNFNGTSASAPHAAAVGALMKQARPDLRPNQIRQILKNTAHDMKDPYSPFSPFDRGQDATTGAGFIDADRALRSLGR
jgi:hypothetical protein